MLPSAPMHDLARRLELIEQRLVAAAARAGRKRSEIQLLGISKTKPVELLQEAVDAGVTALGENKVQEAERKIPRIVGDVEWHLVGHLQSNKTRKAAALFDVIHSLDRPKLVARLNQAAADLGRVLKVYVQVEFVRSGLSDDEIVAQAAGLAEAAAGAPALDLQGLMTLPPFASDAEAARPWFRRLRAIRDQIVSAGIEARGLSMGMSNDFEVAIEEGSTIVRVGTTLFGARVAAGDAAVRE